MNTDQIVVGSRVKALKDMGHNRNPISPSFDIPKNTFGTVEEISPAQTVEGGLTFFVNWEIQHTFKHRRCVYSEIELV